MVRLLIREASGPVLVTDGMTCRDGYSGLILDGAQIRIATGPGAHAVVEIGGEAVTLKEHSVLTTGSGLSRPIVKPFVGRLWQGIVDVLLSPDEQLERWLREEGGNAAVGVRG